ncbi:ABC transporter [Nocardioides dongxiaopingii]|uniref:ABC transporter n=1 Tax=Nocardioides dongxiaopingii TaxID=2576036 RepID=UPI001BB0995C|nr:ABC transporter [Nocardioides dongxiaopingii]
MSPRLIVLAALAVLPLVACSSEPDPSPRDSSAEGDENHGEFAGAVELAEPALGLTTVDAAGVVRHLDLLDESVSELAGVGDASGVHTDGRFAFVQTSGGVDVVDSGVWTWDHVDHFHYYRAEPREVGTVPGTGPATVATTNSSTSGGSGVFFGESGEAVLLDTEALADGELVERYRVSTTPHDGLLVPVGDLALVTEPDASGTAARVLTLDGDGRPVPGGAHPCPDAQGTITTRVAAVIGCADGALLASVVDDELQVERIPYPPGTSAPAATSFAGRDGRPTVAALAGEDRVWLLDTRAESWTLLDSPVPLAQVTAVDDDDEHVVGLSTDGRVVVLDGGSGELLGTSGRLAAASLRSGVGVPTMVADQQRVYLSAPAEKRLYEVDFADDARVARTFETPTRPLYVAGTGR